MLSIYFKSVLVLISLRLMTTFSHVNNNGWIPLTEREFLRNVDRNYDKKSFAEQNFNNEDSHSEIHILKKDAIKMVLPQNLLKFGHENLLDTIEMDIITKQEPKNNQQNCENQDCTLFQTKTTNSYIADKRDEIGVINNVPAELAVGIKNRKPKSILGIDTINDVDKPIKTNFIEKFDVSHLNDASNFNEVTEKIPGIYEVFENLPDVLDNEANDKRFGYTYKQPVSNAEISPEPNTANTFLNILSKYNIKPDDDLPNYALSRQTKGSRPNFMFIPIPLNIPSRLNSFNHFAVDPLLAVFLSNYGYYLPGSYGIQSKYRNLYGYLASNNIHNNKPFGAYKIYSDTDSSS